MREMDARRQFRRPPFSFLARVVSEAPKAEAAAKNLSAFMEESAAFLSSAGFSEGDDFEILGPAKCVIEKRAKSRTQAVCMFYSQAALDKFRAWRLGFKAPRGSDIKIILQPQDFR